VAPAQELPLVDGHELSVLGLCDDDPVAYPDDGQVLIKHVVEYPQPPLLTWEELCRLLQELLGSLDSQKIALVPELRFCRLSQLSRPGTNPGALTTRPGEIAIALYTEPHDRGVIGHRGHLVSREYLLPWL
jgi:hypothetical protein